MWRLLNHRLSQPETTTECSVNARSGTKGVPAPGSHTCSWVWRERCGDTDLELALLTEPHRSSGPCTHAGPASAS